MDLFTDRTSAATVRANQLRPYQPCPASGVGKALAKLHLWAASEVRFRYSGGKGNETEALHIPL